MAMPYRRLGNSGLKVSALSFGAWVTFGNQVGTATARDLMRTAYEAGVNLFDNAESYAGGQAEVVMGDVLQAEGWRRGSYVLSSKVFFGAGHDGPNEAGLSRKHLIEGCHGCLRRLRREPSQVGCRWAAPGRCPLRHCPKRAAVRGCHQALRRCPGRHWQRR